MRVVLDTNILISALISPSGSAASIYESWRNGKFLLISSEEQLDEFRRVTRYPRLRPFIHSGPAGTMVKEIRLLAELAASLPRISVSSDPEDNFLLSMALIGQANFLVTSDKRGLLVLDHFKSTRIVSIFQFLKVLKE